MRFQRQTLIPLDPLAAFDLSLSIDAHLDSFAATGERATAGTTHGIIGMGEFVTWRAKHFGITWTMTSVITEWDRPTHFVDEQRNGPFKSFRHEHRFTAVDGGTRLDDDVCFEAPLGPLGRIAEALVLRRYMPHLIDVRNEFLVAGARQAQGGRTVGEARSGGVVAMSTDETPATPAPGTDSKVEDWFGQSVDRDAELADRLSEELPPDEAERAFEEQASGEDTQDARHGDSIDPEQGESAYRNDG